jgi:cyclohexadienyl dehydratase
MSSTAFGKRTGCGWLVSLALFIACWACWVPVPGWGASSADIRARGVLRVGMSGDYAPFSVCPDPRDATASTSSCQGFEVEAAQRLAADLGVRLDIVRFHWPELRHDLEAERFDVAMSGVTMRPDRLVFGAFTHPYAVAGAVVLVADPQRFVSVAAVDQAGVRVVVNAGGHLEQVARSQFSSATIVATLKNTELPTLVADHRADALLTDSFEAPHFLAEHQNLSALPAFGRDRKAYFVRRADHEWRAWLNQWLAERERDGFLPALRRQWLKERSAQPLSPLTALFALLDLRLAFMPAVADYKQRYGAPIEDPKQEAAVLEHVAAVAREQGRSHETTQACFRVQIELAKHVQRFVLDRPERMPTWARGLDLTAEMRPILVDIGDQILAVLPQLSGLSLTQDELSRLAEEELLTPGVDKEDKRSLGEAVWRLQ